MWFRIVLICSCLFVFVINISSQPITDEPENVRLSRQLDFGDCCPCPDQNDRVPDGRSQDQENILAHVTSVDDCPCRSRSADSEGSPSIFFPTAMRPSTKQGDQKEDVKNLLEPEVGLASSVLETLREATEEEYQDALARDAARARVADENMLSNTVPEESAKSILTIIVNPRQTEEDDVIPEASHIQESRCIHPLGKIRMPPPNPNNEMIEILKLPKRRPIGLLHRNLLDMDSYVGASNVQESVDDPNENIVSSTQYRKHETQMTGNGVFGKLPIFPLLRQNNDLENINKDDTCDDLGFASSNMQERFAEKQNPKLKLKSVIPFENNISQAKKSTPLKSLLKLRDLELIPQGDKNKLLLPKLDLPPLFSSNGNMPLNNLFNTLKLNSKKESTTRNKDKIIKTEIMETLPNETKTNACEIEDMQTKPIDRINVVTKASSFKTDILDTVPNASDIESTAITTNPNSQNELHLKDAETDVATECNLDDSSRDLSPLLEKLLDESESEEIDEKNRGSTETNNEKLKTAIIENLQQGNDNERIESEFPECLNNNESNQDSASFSNNSAGLEKEFGQDNEPLTLKNVESEDLYLEDPELIKNINKKDRESIFLVTKSTDTIKPQSMSETLISFKESVKKKLENIKQKSKLLKPKITTEPNEYQESIENILEGRQISKPIQESYTTDHSDGVTKPVQGNNEIKSDDRLTIVNLQKLSNSLLKLSNKLEKQERVSDVSNQADSGKLDESIASESHFTENYSELSDINKSTVAEPLLQSSVIIHDQKYPYLNDLTSLESPVESAEDTIKPLIKSSPIEMDVSANEPIVSKIFKKPLTLFRDSSLESPLLQDLIVKPAFDPLDGITSSDSDSRNLFNGLPTLDNVAEQLSSIFATNDRDSNDNKSSGDMTCPNDDDQDLETLMSAEPSNRNSQSILAPLEDVNLDLVQVKPLQAQSDELKSFRTKLKLPKTLELKPIKLQSTIGNNGGLLGASLSLGSQPRSRLTAKSIFNKKNTDLIGSRVKNIPRLEDLTQTMRENANNLLEKGRDLLPVNLESIPSVNDLAEDLRCQAESTARNLQHRVESTIRQNKPNSLFGDSLNNPYDILHKIVSAREDLSDKLIGLHHDLNDRLTTLHEHVFDQSRLMSSRIPIMKPDILKDIGHIQNLRNHKTKPMKIVTVENRRETLQKYMHRMKNPQSEDDYKPTKTRLTADNNRSYKPNANIFVPKTVEVHRLEQAIKKTPLSLSRDSGLKELKRTFTTLAEKSPSLINRPVLRKEINPFKDSKFKITFATTTQPPTSPMLKSRLFSTTPIPLLKTNAANGNGNFLTSKATSRMPKYKSFDTKGLPSEVRPLRILAPSEVLKSGTLENEDIKTGEINVLKTDHLPTTRITQSSRYNEHSKEDLQGSRYEDNERREEVSEPAMRKPWSEVKWPKTVDDSFLTQIREAIKMKKSRTDARKSSETKIKHISTIDMAKSASENKEISILKQGNDGHVKESVTYKCKMVCTRE